MKPMVIALLVRLNGNVKFHVEGIITAINNGTIKEYEDLSEGRMSMLSMDKRISNFSFLYYALGDLITHGTEENGWYSNKWKRYPTTECIIDTVFYDEFLFLVGEGLIEVESYEFLSQEKIWANAMAYFDQKDSKFDQRLKPLYDAKTGDELKSIYRKMLHENHPDKNPESDLTVGIIEAYLKLENKFK